MAFKPTDLVFANRDLDNKLKKLNRRIVSAAKSLGTESDTYIKLRDTIHSIAMDTGSHINTVSVKTPSGKTEQVEQISRGGEMKNLDDQTKKAVERKLAEVENVTVSDEMKKIGDKIGVSYKTKLGKAEILKKFRGMKIQAGLKDSKYSSDYEVLFAVAEFTGTSHLIDQYYENMAEFKYMEVDFDRIINTEKTYLDLKIAEIEQEAAEIQKRIDDLMIEINALEEEEEKLQGYDLGLLNAKEIAEKNKELEEENEKLAEKIHMLENGRELQDAFATVAMSFSLRRQARKNNSKKG